MSQQIQITGGAKVRDLQDVIIGTSGVLSSVAFDVANGVPRLDSNGKILVSQLPNSVMEYKGTWNAATNTPTLANGTGNQGDVYLCNVAGTVNFGAGPIAFIVGDSAVYSGSIWQRSGGATGSVTSVGLSTNGGAITIGNSPISTSGTITANFNGTNLQYVNGAGNLTTFPTLMTSVGLTMPSAFTVTNSPLTGAGGTLAVTGAGYASQYIRGDGTLADFPSSGGGGSSVSYYLNGGTSQGTIGGVTYYEMSKTADTGTGVDFTKSGDGFIVAFLTDANDPAQLNIPAGNWNYEIYASMSANGGTPQMYAELYKYDGTTFTLISTSSNEILYDGTNLNLYTFGMTVPATTLALTDRLAIKLYATNSGGKTTTIHTQDSHLCQVITTFSTGITALNGLTAQVQYFQVGTSGTDFNISSTTATHTFNLPDASATARGLITTGTQTIAGTKTFSGIIKGDGGILIKNGVSPTSSGYTGIGAGTSGINVSLGAGGGGSLIFQSTSYNYTFPSATGTLALTSDIPSITGLVPYTGATGAVNLGTYGLSASSLTLTDSVYLQNNKSIWGNNVAGTTQYNLLSLNISNKVAIDAAGLGVVFGGTIGNGTYTYTLPSATGTIALVGGSGVGTVTSVAALTIGTTGTDLSSSVANSTTTPVITLNVPTASATNRGALSSADWTTFNNKQSALTNPVTGTGTTNYLPKFTGTSTIGNSLIQDNGSTVSISTSSTVLSIDRTGGATALLELKTGGTVRGYLGADASVPFIFFNQAASPLMQLNASGNLGLGVTPSAWGSPFTAMQLGTYGQYIAGQTNAADMKIGTNHYYNAGFKYTITGEKAARYDIGKDGFSWNMADAGTAGNAITFTQAMTLTAAGYLSVSGNVATNNPPSYQGLSFGWNKSNGYGESLITYTNIGGGSMPRLDFGYWNGTTYSIQTTIFNSGNVLIGSSVTDAGFKLDVNGTGRFSSSVTAAGVINSGEYTSTQGNNTRLFYSGSATTGYQYMSFKNTSGQLLIGVEGSTTGQLQTNDGAYSTVITTATATRLSLGTNQVERLGFDGTTGAATFSNSVTATSFFESSDSRLKTLIQDNYQTKGIASITPKLYTKNGKVELGYYAQDFVGVLDSAVSKGSDDMLSLSYREVHTAKIYALEQEIKDLKAKMN